MSSNQNLQNIGITTVGDSASNNSTSGSNGNGAPMPEPFHQRHRSSPAQLYISSNPQKCLEELFSGVQNTQNAAVVDGASKSVLPMWKRRLPPSFFRPPSASSSAAHSRESSFDGSSSSNINSFAFSPKTQPPQASQQLFQPAGVSQMSMGKPPTPLSPASHQQQQLHHSTHQLYQPGGGRPGVIPTPPPALVSASGLAVSHARAHSLPASMSIPQQQQQQSLMQAQLQQQTQNFHLHNFEPTEENLARISLPDGWEVALTPSGDRYFLNHREQNTTWDDPRKEILLQQKQLFIQQQQQQQRQQQNFSNIPSELVTALQNMNTNTTTPQVQQAPPPAQTVPGVQQLDANLRALQLERDRYKARQDEIQSMQTTAGAVMANPNNDPFLVATDFNGNHTHSANLNSFSCFGSTPTPATGGGTGNNQTQLPNNDMLGSTNYQDLFESNLLESLDMDVLNDVEDLLNTNRDNIMTWL